MLAEPEADKDAAPNGDDEGGGGSQLRLQRKFGEAAQEYLLPGLLQSAGAADPKVRAALNSATTSRHGIMLKIDPQLHVSDPALRRNAGDASPGAAAARVRRQQPLRRHASLGADDAAVRL